MSMRMADEVMFDGDVLQQPTIPVVKATNMKKKATMNRAIMARPMSRKKCTEIWENVFVFNCRRQIRKILL